VRRSPRKTAAGWRAASQSTRHAQLPSP
jgi:hypothetical protein